MFNLQAANAIVINIANKLDHNKFVINNNNGGGAHAYTITKMIYFI